MSVDVYPVLQDVVNALVITIVPVVQLLAISQEVEFVQLFVEMG